MLLTSSQISLAISSSVIFTFTTLLFLSGYVLQQQTVRSLQAAIRPHLPPPPPSTNPVLAKHFGQPPGHTFYDKFLASNRPKGGWAKVAYVQFVRSHGEVCGAVMGMRELWAGESMAQRIVMYPREWDGVEGDGDGRVVTSRRLLRKAAREFRVMLQPVDAVGEVEGGTVEERFPLMSVLKLRHYNRVLVLRQPGLVLDAAPLDLLFTLPMETSMLGLSDPQDEDRNPLILLFEPSQDVYQDILATLPEGTYPDTEFLSKIPISPAPEDPENHIHLLSQTSSLRIENQTSFNATDFLDRTAYVHFADLGLPGPEFDIPRGKLSEMMPGEGEARRAWEDVYERFREGRVGVCGLDLESVGGSEWGGR